MDENLYCEKNKHEFEIKEIVSTINQLINTNQLEEAKFVMNKYENIINDDIETYSIKAIIAILENRFDDAKILINIGLNIDKNNFDLTYNLAYLYEVTGKYKDSYNYYIKSLYLCTDINIKQFIEKKIDEFNKNIPSLFEDYKNQMKEEIKYLVNNKDLDQASFLIEKYFKIVPDDVAAFSIKAIILILKNNFKKAEAILKEGLSLDSNNCDLLYNLAYVYEQTGLYLNSLEIYESLILNSTDIEIKNTVIKHLNELENVYKVQITQQLQVRNQKQEKADFESKKQFIHLMYDSQYNETLIQLINKNFSNNEHKFVIIHDKNHDLKLMNAKCSNNIEVLDLRFDLQKLISYIDNSSRIFFHFLSDLFCELICKLNITKPMYWTLWGGDLYCYIDNELYDQYTKKVLIGLRQYSTNKIDKNSISYIYRRSAIKKINYILCRDKYEFKLIEDNFITAAKRLDFFYPSPVNFEHLIINSIHIKPTIKKILIGNSSNPSNNHIDAFIKLKNIQLKDDYEVLVPLSYGGNKDYIGKIIEYGSRLFGDKFKPLLNYMNSQDYFDFLSTIDVAIFYHNRQQGLGNVCLLNYLCKKVYIKNQIESYKYLKDMGIYLNDANVLDETLFTYDINVIQQNKEYTTKFFSEGECLKLINQIII